MTIKLSKATRAFKLLELLNYSLRALVALEKKMF
jgi:hypothetical protein